MERIVKCLKALYGVNEWDRRICPFCGKSQTDKHGYHNVSHENDCPVQIADDILSYLHNEL